MTGNYDDNGQLKTPVSARTYINLSVNTIRTIFVSAKKLRPKSVVSTKVSNAGNNIGIRMFFNVSHFLVIVYFAVVAMVVNVSLSAASRLKRSDDGGPLEAVVEQLSQQVASLTARLNTVNTEVAALKTKTGERIILCCPSLHAAFIMSSFHVSHHLIFPPFSHSPTPLSRVFFIIVIHHRHPPPHHGLRSDITYKINIQGS